LHNSSPSFLLTGSVASDYRSITVSAFVAPAPIVYRVEPVIASALSILATPILVVAGAVIMVLSRRSPFVAHRRVGMSGTPFWMWKLRTMWCDSDPRTGRWQFVERIENSEIPEDKSLALDPRLRNRFSAFCRKHSIDELPQLFQVACGRMSLVGPRPITRKELDRHYGSRADEILRLRPGLTGLWQVNGRSALTYEQRCRMDLALVRGFSLKLYIAILLRTIPKLINGAGSH
jgi:lipopolysaccharide/colanic/teichoic acid biosynthesis glycosyltransferase